MKKSTFYFITVERGNMGKTTWNAEYKRELHDWFSNDYTQKQTLWWFFSTIFYFCALLELTDNHIEYFLFKSETRNSSVEIFLKNNNYHEFVSKKQ